MNVDEFKFYTNKGGQLKVKCSGTIQFPDSTTGTVEAESQSVSSLRPTVNHWNILTGAVLLGQLNGFGSLVFNGSGQATRGQDWYANVSVPSPFSGGTPAWVQLIKPNRHTISHGPSSQDIDTTLPHNDTEGLDSVFPYDKFADVDVVGGDANTGDSPYRHLGGYRVTVTDTARTWIMFLPDAVATGQSTTWVPLSMYTWTWSGIADRVTLPNGSSNWTLTSSSVPINPTAANSYDHPTWAFKHTGK